MFNLQDVLSVLQSFNKLLGTWSILCVDLTVTYSAPLF